MQSVSYLIISLVSIAVSLFLYLGSHAILEAERSKYKGTVNEIVSILQDQADGKEIDPEAASQDTNKDTTDAIDLMQKYNQEFRDLNDVFKNKIVELKIGDSLSPETLKDNVKIKAARKSIGQMLAVLEDQKKSQTKLHADYQKKIQQLDVPIYFRKKLDQSFDEMKASLISDYNKFYDIEKKILQKSDSILAFMDERKDKYYFEGEDVNFINNFEDANRYKILTTEVETVITQEEGYQKTMKKNAQDRIDQVRKTLEG